MRNAKPSLALALGLALIGGVACDDENELDSNLVDTAIAAGSFSTLVSALEATDLDATLASGGPYTVFAPTDEAFDALPAGALDALLQDPDVLRDVLLYHVLDGEVFAEEVVTLGATPTLSGIAVNIDVTSGVKVNGATVVQTDIRASNGVIHVIDEVLLPPNLVQVAEAAGSFTTLLAALDAAGLTQTLETGGPFTVFAPTDEAFAALPAGTLDALLQDADALRDILLYHVVDGEVRSEQVVNLSSAPTLLGQSVTIDASSGVSINDADVVAVDVLATNGVIHVIDKVLLPN